MMVLVSPNTPHQKQTLTSITTNGSYFQTPISSRTKTRKVSRTPSKLGEETDPFDLLLESFILSEHEPRNRSRDYAMCKAKEEDEKQLRSSATQQNIAIKLEELMSDDESDEIDKVKCMFMFCSLGARPSTHERGSAGTLHIAPLFCTVSKCGSVK